MLQHIGYKHCLLIVAQLLVAYLSVLAFRYSLQLKIAKRFLQAKQDNASIQLFFFLQKCFKKKQICKKKKTKNTKHMCLEFIVNVGLSSKQTFEIAKITALSKQTAKKKNLKKRKKNFFFFFFFFSLNLFALHKQPSLQLQYVMCITITKKATVAGF